jgi:hypothetical protein
MMIAMMTLLATIAQVLRFQAARLRELTGESSRG